MSSAVLLTALIGGAAVAAPRTRPQSSDRISPRGYVESVQSACFARPGSLDATPCSAQVQQAYVRHIDGMPLVRTRTGADGRTEFKLGPLTLVRLGPIEAGKPGVTHRHAEGGLLILPGNRGQALFQTSVQPCGQGAEVKLRLGNYQPMLRGSGPRAPLREAFYKQTQLRIHRWAGLKFLRELSLPPRR